MHALQPKQTILKSDEVKKILTTYNVALSQLPKIRIDDPSAPKNCVKGDVVKIERSDGKQTAVYYRVVV